MLNKRSFILAFVVESGRTCVSKTQPLVDELEECCVDSLDIQGLHCLTHRNDESLTDGNLVLTRLLKDTEKGECESSASASQSAA